MSAGAKALIRGGNTEISSLKIEARVGWQLEAKPKIFACLVNADGKLLGLKGGLVAHFGQETSCRSVRLSNAQDNEVRFLVDFAQVPEGVAKILFCAVAAPADKISIGCLGLKLSVFEAATATCTFELLDQDTPASSALIGELYQRNGKWKLRALGQGFKDGLEPLASFLGGSAAGISKILVAPVVATRSAAAEKLPSPPAARPSPARASVSSLNPPSSISPLSAAPKPVMVDTRFRQADGAGVGLKGLFVSGDWLLSPEGIVGDPAQPSLKPHFCELLDVRPDKAGCLWPAFFEVHPLNGSALPPFARQDLISGRSLTQSGLPDLSFIKSINAETFRSEDIPDGARYFAAGGNPARLLALDPAIGQAWWKAPVSNRWIPLGRCPTVNGIPAYAIGLAGAPTGVFYCSDDGLVHLLPNQQPKFVRKPLEGVPVGAPAVLENLVIFPVRTNAGLAIGVMGTDGAVTETPVPGSDQESHPLGAPVLNFETSMCFWPGVTGYLTFEIGIEGSSARWCKWPKGIEGLPFLRPYRAPNGRFWAMATEVADGGRGRAVACLMSGGRASEINPLLGPFLSVGTQTFRGRSRHQEPWREAVEEINLGFDFEGRWLLPLLRLAGGQTIVGLVEDVSSGTDGGIRDFIFREGSALDREISLAVHSDQGALKLLSQAFRISSTDDFELFVDSGRLCIHHFESNQCASWSLNI